MNLSHLTRSIACATTMALATGAAWAVSVPGTSNPKLAGMPAGSTDGSDTAPEQSPVLFTDFALVPGNWLSFSVTGVVGHCRGCEADTPDGATDFKSADRNGIAGMTGPINSLVGVFLTDAQPDLSATPDFLDFRDPTASDPSRLGTAFATLEPGLKQVFFIGDGFTGTGSGLVQRFYVPEGATRLYLATHDGFGWYNNVGAFEVTVTTVPEPAAWALMVAGLAGIGASAQRRRRAG
jgi:PEP-CTERM motif